MRYARSRFKVQGAAEPLVKGFCPQIHTDFHRFFFIFIQQILQIFANKAEKLPV
jgi:hypothetical protein